MTTATRNLVPSIDAARILGVYPQGKNWSERLARRIRNAGFRVDSHGTGTTTYYPAAHVAAAAVVRAFGDAPDPALGLRWRVVYRPWAGDVARLAVNWWDRGCPDGFLVRRDSGPWEYLPEYVHPAGAVVVRVLPLGVVRRLLAEGGLTPDCCTEPG